jgi:hypothetical protein
VYPQQADGYAVLRQQAYYVVFPSQPEMRLVVVRERARPGSDPENGLRLGLQVVRGKSRLSCGCLAVIGRPKMPGALRPTKDLAALFIFCTLFCTLPREHDRSAGSCRLARGIQNANYCDVCIQRREPGWLNFSGDDGN